MIKISVCAKRIENQILFCIRVLSQVLYCEETWILKSFYWDYSMEVEEYCYLIVTTEAISPFVAQQRCEDQGVLLIRYS